MANSRSNLIHQFHLQFHVLAAKVTGGEKSGAQQKPNPHLSSGCAGVLKI